MLRCSFVVCVLILLSLQPNRSAAQSGLRADVETDITAFVLEGYSLHVGLGYERLRIDLGAFAMAVPEVFHGQRDFDASFDGFGIKAQYFVFEAQTGGFVGIDVGFDRRLIALHDSQLKRRIAEVGAGVHLGWRFDLPLGFYVTPWVGVGYTFGVEDTVLDGHRFDASPWNVFPAIHIGYHLP